MNIDSEILADLDQTTATIQDWLLQAAPAIGFEPVRLLMLMEAIRQARGSKTCVVAQFMDSLTLYGIVALLQRIGEQQQKGGVS